MSLANRLFVRWRPGEDRVGRTSPRPGPEVEAEPCPVCGEPLAADVTLFALGPTPDDDSWNRHAAGRWYSAAAIAVHATCLGLPCTRDGCGRRRCDPEVLPLAVGYCCGPCWKGGTTTTTTTNTFNLRALIRAELDSSPASDPGEIAEDVLVAISDEHLREALRETLRGYVRTMIHGQRMNMPPPQIAPPSSTNRSPHVKAIREAWRRHLADRYRGVAEWKTLAEMTRDDLLAEVARRKEAARQNSINAATFQRWADEVRKHKVARFGQLPADVLEGLLS